MIGLESGRVGMKKNEKIHVELFVNTDMVQFEGFCEPGFKGYISSRNEIPTFTFVSITQFQGRHFCR